MVVTNQAMAYGHQNGAVVAKGPTRPKISTKHFT